MRKEGERRILTANRVVALGCLLVTAAAPVAGQDITKLNEAALRVKVAQFVAAFAQSSGIPRGKPQTVTQFVDLNGDGRLEALTVIQDLPFCGASGCTAFVLDLTGTKARSIGDFFGESLKPLASKTNGWQDLSVDGHRATFANGKYGPATR